MPANSSICHNVPDMRQPQTWACWYTSLQMVVAYEKSRGNTSLIDPSKDPEASQIFTSNQGIGRTPGEREKIARKLGFNVGYVSLSSDGMWEMLGRGPVIYAGYWPGQQSGHWIVIKGISDQSLSINNPAAGPQIWDYNYFMGQYLLQSADPVFDVVGLGELVLTDPEDVDCHGVEALACRGLAPELADVAGAEGAPLRPPAGLHGLPPVQGTGLALRTLRAATQLSWLPLLARSVLSAT